MRILHICNAFQTNTLYSKLFYELDLLKFEQVVIAPGKNASISTKNNQIIHCVEVNRSFFARLLWAWKILRLYRYIKKNVEIPEIDVIHAHTLFSDGTVAFLISRLCHKPYCVAVRNTDLNSYFKLPVFKKLGYKLLKKASSVFLISESNYSLFKKILPNEVYKDIIDKTHVIPNGINGYWLQNINIKNRALSSPVSLIYAGDICKNKNLHNVLSAMDIDGGNIIDKFTVYGLDEDDASSYVNSIKYYSLCHPEFILNKRCKKEELRVAFKTADIYIQPSFTETFGLSYIEALTQGLPVIYSEGQGIDGMFKEGLVGYHVDPNRPEDILEKIKNIVSHYDEIQTSLKGIDFNRFSWETIAKEYMQIYLEMIMS